MKSKMPIIIISVVAACIVCIAAVLGIKMSNGNDPAIDIESDSYYDYQNTTEYTYPVYNEYETIYPEQSLTLPEEITTTPVTETPTTLPATEETTVSESNSATAFPSFVKV